jgi:hypothetical protein
MKCNVDKSSSGGMKAYSNNRVAAIGSKPSSLTSIPHKFIPDSSSLFCSQLDGKMEALGSGGGGDNGGGQQITTGSEYSLFGPRGFVTSFAR